jgi:hypothetical protein
VWRVAIPNGWRSENWLLLTALLDTLTDDGIHKQCVRGHGKMMPRMFDTSDRDDDNRTILCGNIADFCVVNRAPVCGLIWMNLHGENPET